MPTSTKNRKTRAALRGGKGALDEITELILLLQERKSEKERQRIEDERAGRAEGREVERLGFARERLGIAKAGIAEEKAGKIKTAKETSDALAAPAVQTAVSGFREAEGVDAANLRVQQLGGAQTPQEATSMAIQLQTDTEKAMKLIGERKKEDTKEQEFQKWLDGIPEPFRSRMEAIGFGLDVKSATQAFPLSGEDETKLSDDDKFWLNKMWPLIQADMSPEEIADQMAKMGLSRDRAADLMSTIKQSKNPTVVPSDTSPTQVTPDRPPEIGAESEAAPTVTPEVGAPATPIQEGINPADLAPAGAIPPEEATLGTAVIPGQEFTKPIPDEAPQEDAPPQDVEAAVLEWINSGRPVADIDTAKLARYYDTDENEVKNIVSRFANTAR